MTIQNIIAGLTILQKYQNEKGGFNIGAEHGKIYAYATDRGLESADVEQMVELGWQWHQDAETEGDEDAFEYYGPKASWQAFV